MTHEQNDHRPENPFNQLFEGDKGLKDAQVWVCAFLIGVAALIVYSNSFTIPFTGSDRDLIGQGILLGGTAPMLESDDTPRLLPLMSLSFNAWLQPAGLAGYRALSLLFHITASLMLFFLCRRLFRKRIPEPMAMLAGMLFALHPVATESLHILADRGGLMAVSFMLCALVAALRFLEPRASGRNLAPALALGFFALAWASGVVALLFPPLLLMADWVAHGRRKTGRRMQFHLAVWAFAGFLAFLSWAMGAAPTASLTHLPGPVVFLMRLLAEGRGLSIVHPVSVPTGLLDWAVIAVAVVVGLFLLARRSVMGMALLWVAMALLIVALCPGSTPMTSERLLYPALAGAVLAGPWLLRVLRWTPLVRVAAGLAAAMLVVAAGLGTFMRNSEWNNPMALYTEAEKVAPDSIEVHQRLGELYLEQGRMAMAQVAAATDQTSAALDRDRALSLMAAAGEHLQRMVDAAPDRLSARINLGTALAMQGATDESIRVIEDALQSSPRDLSATIGLASLYAMRAETDENRKAVFDAVVLFERANELGTLPPAVMMDYAMALMRLGDIERAGMVFHQLGAQEESSPLHPRYQQVSEAMRQLQELEGQAQALAARKAAPAQQLVLRAQALVQRGNYLHAAYLLEDALRRDAGHVPSWAILGMIRGINGDADRFLQEHPAPIAMASGQTSPFLDLARICMINNRWDLARKYLEHPSARIGTAEPPLVALASLAGELGANERAAELLREAAEAYPDNPAAHLRMAAIALEGKDAVSAQGYLDEATRRGAPETALVPLREQLSQLQKEGAGQAPMTILR